MKTVELKGTTRSAIGKAAMKKIRRAGNVPAVVYGQGEPTAVAVDFQAMTKVLHSPETYVVKLDLEGSGPANQIGRHCKRRSRRWSLGSNAP